MWHCTIVVVTWCYRWHHHHSLRCIPSLYENYIFLTKITAAQNEVALSCHRVRELYFLAVIFVASIIEGREIYNSMLCPQKDVADQLPPKSRKKVLISVKGMKFSSRNCVDQASLFEVIIIDQAALFEVIIIHRTSLFEVIIYQASLFVVGTREEYKPQFTSDCNIMWILKYYIIYRAIFCYKVLKKYCFSHQF